MSDLELMQSIQSLHHLYKDIPHIILRKLIPIPLELKYFLQEITSISVLHNNAS